MNYANRAFHVVLWCENTHLLLAFKVEKHRIWHEFELNRSFHIEFQSFYTEDIVKFN